MKLESDGEKDVKLEVGGENQVDFDDQEINLADIGNLEEHEREVG